MYENRQTRLNKADSDPEPDPDPDVTVTGSIRISEGASNGRAVDVQTVGILRKLALGA